MPIGASVLATTGPFAPSCDLEAARKLGRSDYTELGLPGEHIGMLFSGKQGIVGKGVVDWLVERDG